MVKEEAAALQLLLLILGRSNNTKTVPPKEETALLVVHPEAEAARLSRVNNRRSIVVVFNSILSYCWAPWDRSEAKQTKQLQYVCFNYQLR